MGKLDAEASNVGQHRWGSNGDRLRHTFQIVSYGLTFINIYMTLCLSVKTRSDIACHDKNPTLKYQITEFFQFYLEFLLRNLKWLMQEGTIRFAIYLKAKSKMKSFLIPKR